MYACHRSYLCMEEEGVKMDLKLENISPEEMEELQRNVFMATLEQIKAWAKRSRK